MAPELWLKIFVCMVHLFKPGTRPAFESFFRKFVARSGPGSVVVFLRWTEGGSANEPLAARGYRAGFLFLSAVNVWLVGVCFLPVFLFWVWIGVFGGWGEAMGKPWKTGLVGIVVIRADSGLFSGIWQ